MNMLTVNFFFIVLIATTSAVYQKFSEAILKEIVLSETNQLICPISLEVLMALLSVGAQNTTLDEIITVFGFDKNVNNTWKFYNELLNSFYPKTNDSIYMANKIFVRNNNEISKSFKDIAVSVFLSDIQKVDFSKSEETAELINKFVEDKTFGKIHDLVKPSDFNSATSLILINTLYFKQPWLKFFSEYDTKKRPFYQANGSAIEVDMMNNMGTYNYAFDKDLDAQILEILYQNINYSMVIVLPKSNKFELLQKNVSKIFTADLRSQMVNVTIPKFRIESHIEFQPILDKLGMKELFTNEAKLSGLLENKEDLKVSAIIQKTFIDVTEKGTEAAAATKKILERRVAYKLHPKPVQFIANKPFIFFIRILNLHAFLLIGTFVAN